MFDGLVNGANDIFKTSTTYCDKTSIWIMFQICKTGTLTREKYNHYYNNIELKWTPIERIIKNIGVGKSQSFIIIKIQFLIQLAIVRTIHHFKGLSLDELVFYPTNVEKHELTYTTLFHI
jgi:hypothetical protein